MGKIKVTQVRSAINRPKSQKATIKALGLRKMNHSVIIDTSVPQLMGMVAKISHLVRVEDV